LIKGLDDTTLNMVRNRVETFYRTPGMTMGELRADLEPYFGERRAENIAVTEVTNAYAEGEKLAAERAMANGQTDLMRYWHTNRDEKVCAICRAQDGKPEFEWTSSFPAHPHDRCWTTYNWVG
jgi:hypothetical protein